MFTKLENYLDKWVSIERKTAIIDALKILDSYGYLSAWAEISSYLESATDESLMMIIDTIEGIINIAIDQVLSAHTIIMDGGYVLKTALLRGLLVVPVYSDCEHIQAITMESSNPIETLCDILELTTEYKYQDYIDFIVSVSTSLIDKMNSLATGNVDNQEIDDDEDLDPKRKQLLINFLNLYKNSIAQVELLDNLLPPGIMEIEFLIENHKRQLIELEPMGFENAAMEILGLVLISNSDINIVLKTCKENLDIIFTDINFIGKVDMALTNVYNKVYSHGQT